MLLYKTGNFELFQDFQEILHKISLGKSSLSKVVDCTFALKNKDLSHFFPGNFENSWVVSRPAIFHNNQEGCFYFIRKVEFRIHL